MAAAKQELPEVEAVGEEVDLGVLSAALWRADLSVVPGEAGAKEEEEEAGATEEIDEAEEATQEAEEGQALRATEDPYMPFGPRLELPPVKRQEPEVPVAAGSSTTEARLVANQAAGYFAELAALPPAQEKKRPRRPQVIE